MLLSQAPLDQRGAPLKRPRTFTTEYRRLPARPGVRTFLQYAAEPDRITELHSLADELQNIPRDMVTCREDIFHFNRRVAGRIHKIADGIEIIEPIAIRKTGAAPKMARIGERLRRQNRASEDQLAMAL